MSCLTLLKDGKQDHEPYFFFHALTGSASIYNSLAHEIQDDGRCWAVNAVGIDGNREPLDRIPVMAKNYFRAALPIVRTPMPRLVGWSYGGLLAHEVSILFKDAGYEPKLVVLDCLLLLGKQDNAQVNNDRILKVFMDLLSKSPQTLQSNNGFSYPQAMDQRLDLAGVIDRATSGNVSAPVDLIRSLLRVMQANLVAQTKYTPTKLENADVLFIKGGGEHAGTESLKTLDYCYPGGYAYVPVEMDHYSMLAEDNSMHLAKIFHNWIDKGL